MRLLTICPLILLFQSCTSFVVPNTPLKNSKVSLHAIPDAIIGGQVDQIIEAGAAAVAAIVGGAAFALKNQGTSTKPEIKESDSSTPSIIGISIPYDAAAKLAYDEWRSVNDKGEYDEAIFSTFKDLYNSKVVAEVTLKKCARDLAGLKNGKAEDNTGSVRYDAAARLAYDEWRDSNNKGEFDEEGFAGFKPIYNAKSAAEAGFKKVEREMANL